MGSATKIEWRGDWRAAARIVKDGWVAEMAIPFSILRYPLADRPPFGVCFARRLKRTEAWSDWPRMKDDSAEPQLRRLDGGRGAVHRPKTAADALHADYAETDHVGVISGLDAKHTFDNGVVAVATGEPGLPQR